MLNILVNCAHWVFFTNTCTIRKERESVCCITYGEQYLPCVKHFFASRCVSFEQQKKTLDTIFM